MIEGLTHENGVLHRITKYRGKISTGFAPGESPSKANYPTASGFFRILKEQTRTERIGKDKKATLIKEWVLNEEVQKALEKSLPTPSTMPRRIEIVCLYKTVPEMWETSLAMYSKSEGLECKSHGRGTNAKKLQFSPNGEREWIDRNGKDGCQFQDCPDYKSGKCKPIGLLKCFPLIDMSPNPYRFETRSINTIMGIESSFQDLQKLLSSAHAVKQIEAGTNLPNDGFFGAKLYLVLRKIKSGGKDVYITDLMPTPSFTEMVMEPIKRGLVEKEKIAKLTGSAGAVSILSASEIKLLEKSDIIETDINEEIPLELSDQQEIAVNFGADADEPTDIDIVNMENSSTKIPDDSRSGEEMGKIVAESLMEEEVKKLPSKN